MTRLSFVPQRIYRIGLSCTQNSDTGYANANTKYEQSRNKGWDKSYFNMIGIDKIQ